MLRKWIFLLITSVICAAWPRDQVCAQQIQLRNNQIGELKPFYEGEKLKTNQLKQLLLGHQQTYDSFNRYARKTNMRDLTTVLGSGLIGGVSALAILAQEPNLIVGGIGLSLLAISIPFRTSANRHLRETVDLYNQSLHEDVGSIKGPNLQLVVSLHSLKLLF